MPIQLDKILQDISEEKTLHPNFPSPTKKEMDDAWTRVGKKNKLSVHECRSIFKVLQKKYEQERVKNVSAWKLFNVMDEIHKKVEVKVEVKLETEPDVPVEEDEEYEMLEVQEEEEHSASAATPTDSLDASNTGAGSTPRDESQNKCLKSNSSTGSPEKDEKPSVRNVSTASSSALREDRKVLNSLPNVTNKISVGGTTQPLTPMQKKSITLRKTFPATPTGSLKIVAAALNVNKVASVRGGNNSPLEVGQTIQLPESIKRKLSEEHTSYSSMKRSNISHATVGVQQQPSPTRHNSSTSLSPERTQIKQEHEDEKLDTQAQPAHGINLITIPSNPILGDLTNGAGAAPTTATDTGAAAAAASNSTNGSHLDKIDFRNDIIFDTGHGGGGINGMVERHQQGSNRATNHHPNSEIINLGNFNNSLPPTFFKNLCNSSRHEALGLYVANVMNRLDVRSAAKLELGILRAIIDIQSDELGQ